MSRKLKIAILLLGLLLVVVFVLWYPYECGSVPEWNSKSSTRMVGWPQVRGNAGMDQSDRKGNGERRLSYD
jgi:hypothetical protein